MVSLRHIILAIYSIIDSTYSLIVYLSVDTHSIILSIPIPNNLYTFIISDINIFLVL